MPQEIQRGEITDSAITEFLPLIEAALERACQFDDKCPERLEAAIRYALLAPGKRLRPALVMMAAEACGCNLETVVDAATAVEMIHAYSLIHDDLPAMDDDDLRRGRPTVHIQFDEATAILAGDALQALAFGVLAKSIRDPLVAVQAIRTLALAAGPEALVGGQADDLAAESGGLRTIETLERIHRRKTGALFAASLRIGGLVAGANETQLLALDRYADNVGLAFQVVDDLLDATATVADLGKRSGKDSSRGKLTYPGLLGIEASREYAKRLLNQAKIEVGVFNHASWRLIWLADFVLARTS